MFGKNARVCVTLADILSSTVMMTAKSRSSDSSEWFQNDLWKLAASQYLVFGCVVTNSAIYCKSFNDTGWFKIVFNYNIKPLIILNHFSLKMAKIRQIWPVVLKYKWFKIIIFPNYIFKPLIF